MRAADTDNENIVNLLAACGADINARYEGFRFNGTALFRAASRGSEPMVKCLLRLKAQVNLAFKNEYTSLYVAAKNGHKGVVQLLIAADANPNAIITTTTTKTKWSSLQSSYKRVDIVRILLAAGADIDYHSCPNGTCLYRASRSNHLDVVKLLLKNKAGLEMTECSAGVTALMTALVNGNTEIAKELLNADAKVDCEDIHKRAPLHYALTLCSTMKDDELLRMVLKHRPQLNIRDWNGNTALNLLNSGTPVSAVEILIEKGAHLESRNRRGYSPLSTAIRGNNIAVVKYLISLGANINITSGFEGAPLHLACQKANLDMVKLLIKHGADVNLLAKKYSWTPLQSACCRQVGHHQDMEIKKQIILYLIN